MLIFFAVLPGLLAALVDTAVAVPTKVEHCERESVFTAAGTASTKKRATNNALAKLDHQLKALAPPKTHGDKAAVSCKKSWWWRCEASIRKCP